MRRFVWLGAQWAGDPVGAGGQALASVSRQADVRAADDIAQFDALLDESVGAMTRVAAALIGAADAEDAVQEAVVRAWRAWPTLRERDAAPAWLNVITVNVCRNWLAGRFGSRRRLTESLAEHDEEPTLATLETNPGDSDYAAALDLRAAINALDEDLRLIVALRYYANLDSSEIGSALGVPAATVRTRLRRAVGQLRERLTDATNVSISPEGRR